MMPPAWTPQKTIELMLDQRRLSARLALAIAHLDQSWEDLRYQVRLRGSEDPKLMKARIALRQSLQTEDLASPPLRLDKVNQRSEAWLRSAVDADLLTLLAYVVEIDSALQPDAAIPGRLRVLRSRHEVPRRRKATTDRPGEPPT